MNSGFWSTLNQYRLFIKNLKNFPYVVKSPDALIKRNNLSARSNSIALDLGCGTYKRNPFHATRSFGADIRENLESDIYRLDLSLDVIPFDDNTFDFVTAYDFLEHVPRHSFVNGKMRYLFVDLMDEIYRILKPGGYFLHRSPAFPKHSAFTDPTHVNFITCDTMRYFCLNKSNTVGASMYGFKGSFRMLDSAWVKDTWIVQILQKTC